MYGNRPKHVEHVIPTVELAGTVVATLLVRVVDVVVVVVVDVVDPVPFVAETVSMDSEDMPSMQAQYPYVPAEPGEVIVALPPLAPLEIVAMVVPEVQPWYDFIVIDCPLHCVSPDTVALTLDDGAAGFGARPSTSVPLHD